MTPARRRKLITRASILLLVVVCVIFWNNSAFLYPNLPWQERIAAVIMGRRPGSAKPGTVLVRTISKPAAPNATNSAPASAAAPSTEPPARLGFDLLGKWKFEEGKTPIPEKVKKLHGHRVEIAGLMLSLNQVQAINRFVLVQSLWSCCFGQVPAPNHVIIVSLPADKIVTPCQDPILVTGVFKIEETRDGKTLSSIYTLEADQVVVR